jgi:hypothetical protein
LVFPGLATARWVWLLPTAVLSLGLIWDFIDFGAGAEISEYFFCAHPGRGEACLTRTFFTYPAWACVWYSIGAALASRRACMRASRDTLESGADRASGKEHEHEDN